MMRGGSTNTMKIGSMTSLGGSNETAQRNRAAAPAPGPSRAASMAPVADDLELSEEAREIGSSSGTIQSDLSPEQEEQVEDLQARDREVRAHEQAHLAAAGPYVISGPTYDFQRGPDGRQYAVGGEVQIDTAPVEGDPEATIRKAQVIRAAALAPAEPSSQDRAVAAAASQLQSQAQAELIQQRQAERSGDDASQDEGSDRQATSDLVGVIRIAYQQQAASADAFNALF